jgi:biotin carboxylase
MRIAFLALNPTDSVTEGFLPAAHQLGAEVVLLTDDPPAHATAYAGCLSAPREIVHCNVRDIQQVIGVLSRLGGWDVIFSNSDHLQTQCALAAAYFGLPGKDWMAAARAKNKGLMRRHLAQAGLDLIFSVELAPGDDPATLSTKKPPYPCVVKPREGVASEDVYLVEGSAELASRVAEIRTRRPGKTLVIEQFLDGPLHTLDTLGDSTGHIQVLGGFQVTNSPPPYFIGERLDWRPRLPSPVEKQLLLQLEALGVGFGACHTEFILQDAGPRLVEVNYRLIMDQCDLLLRDLLDARIFEYVLLTHLGQPAPQLPTTTPHGRLDYVFARSNGVLRAAPDAHDVDGDVRLSYRPLRQLGDTVTLSHSERDCLGVLRAIGANQQSVDAAVEQFMAANRWELQA